MYNKLRKPVQCSFCGNDFYRTKNSLKNYCCQECKENADRRTKYNRIGKSYRQITKDNQTKSKKLEELLMKQSQNGFISYGQYQVQLAKYEAEKKEIQRTATSSKEYETRIREAAKKYGI